MRMLNQLLQQAQAMQDKMAEVQERLGQETVEGKSGGGLVTVALDGKGKALRLKIDPSVVRPGEAEIIEDLVLAALADARSKQEALMATAMRDVTGGLPLPKGLF